MMRLPCGKTRPVWFRIDAGEQLQLDRPHGAGADLRRAQRSTDSLATPTPGRRFWIDSPMQWRRLLRDCLQPGETRLRNPLRLAVQNSGQAHQNLGSTCRALLRTITDAIAVLAQISRFQGDQLHRGVCHRSTPNFLTLVESDPVDTPRNCLTSEPST